MTALSNRKLVRSFKAASRGAAAFAAAVGALALAGWVFDIAAFKSLLPHLATLKANTAICFILAGGALWLLNADCPAPAPRRGAQAATLAFMLIAALTLCQYLFGWRLGIDELLFKDPGPQFGLLAGPGRMSPATALNFLLLGAALLLLGEPEAPARSLAIQGLALLILLLMALALTAFIFNVQSLYHFTPYSQVALHTVLALMALSLGTLAARPEHGLMQWVTRADVGGAIARRLLPVALLTPLLLGWFSQIGVRHGLYEPTIATAIRIVMTIVIFAGVVLWLARSLSGADAVRRRAEERLREAHKALQASAHRTRGIIDGASDLIAALDPEFRFIAFNQAYSHEFQTLFGVAPALGLRLPDALAHLPEERAKTMEAWARAVQGEEFCLTQEYGDPQGGRHYYEITFSAIRGEDGESLGAAQIVRNVTERRQAELALRHTADELARSNAELEQFAYVASHDLQEPLRAVAGCVQLLQRRCQEKLDERGDELIRHAVDGAQRMQNLINDLLAYSRVGTKGRPFEPVESAEALRAALKNLEVALRESGAAVIPGPLPRVTADPVQIVQLLQNLVGNAIKFRSAEPPRIEVGARRAGEEWEFRVSDNGIGIEPQYHQRIFSVFQRLHTAREYPGTGIGLAICKKIVERHGGRIWVEPAAGRGTTFCFTVPNGRTTA